MSFTVEDVIKVWDDETGEHIYIGPDGDGLELVELRYVEADGKCHQRMTFQKEQALLVADAIRKLYA